MERGKFIVCKASAGAGKTFTLVKTFIALALDAGSDAGLEQRFKSILAITFTNKAANEMKERILSSLKSIAEQGCSDGMGEMLQKELEIDESELKRRCGLVKRAILHNYSDLSVCTIDSFMHRIVRTFAHDLNLPMNFDVMIDNSNLIQGAVEALMGLAGAEGEEQLTKVLCDFAEMQMEESKGYDIEKKIRNLAKQLFKEDVPEYLEQIEKMSISDFGRVYRELHRDNQEFEKALSEIGAQARTTYSQQGLSSDDFFHSSSGITNYFNHLEQKNYSEPGRYALDFAEGRKLGSSRISEATQATLEAVAPELRRLFYLAEEKRKAGISDYNSRKLLMTNLYTLAVMNKLQELVQQCSTEEEVVHISEFNKSIAEVVNNEPAPYLYERLGSRYKNFLIDEFQDTSKLQWQNLVPLVENGVSSGATSLVVGDGKQAIYRFRQGDVSQFVKLPEVDNKIHGKNLSQPEIARILPLQDNQRSGEAIVEFNNDFFAWAAGERYPNNEELRQAYLGKDPDKPELAQNSKHRGGYVELGFWEGDDAKEAISKQLSATIQHLVKDCGYHYSDITLLARDNRILSHLAEFFSNEEGGRLPLVSSESFLMSNSKVVMMLRSLIDYLIDSQDRLAAAQVIAYLKMLGKITHDTDDHFAQKKSLILEEILREEGIELECDRLRSLPLYDCIEEVFRQLKIEGIERAYCSALLNTVAAYSKSHRQSFTEFREWFDQNIENLSAKASSSSDAITLTTIHKAKGLAAPVILYPIYNKKAPNNQLWVKADEKRFHIPIGIVLPKKDETSYFDAQFEEERKKEELDQLNILYVALTRPREKIYVYSEYSSKKEDNNYATLLHSYIKQNQGIAQQFTAIEGGNGERYRLGEESASEKRGETHQPNVRVEQISYGNWSDRIVIAESREEIVGEQQQERIARGLQMHDILSRIHYPKDVASAVSDYGQQHKLEESEQEELMRMICKLIEQPDWAPYFDSSAQIKTECNILHHGKILRPDRIVILPDRTWIVDFKTGAEHASYQAQIEGYCEAVRAMGYPNVGGVLLYL